MTAAVFQICSGTKQGKQLKLPLGTITMGRSCDCDVRLRGDDVSRIHCELRVNQSKIEIRDLHSRNGTYLNGSRIVQPATISVGDRISIGGFEFQLVWLAKQADVPSQTPTSEPVKPDPNQMTLDELVQFDDDLLELDIEPPRKDPDQMTVEGSIGNFGTTIVEPSHADRKDGSATPAKKSPDGSDATRDAARTALRKIFHGKS